MHTLFQRNSCILLLLLASMAFTLQSCSDDSSSTSPARTDDYFPFGREHRWTYTTNIFEQAGSPVVLFDMKIDTAISNDRMYWFLMAKLHTEEVEWGKIIGLKDDGNNIYSIGDHPPEDAIKLWQHSYSASEAVSETISVQGKTYNTMRVDYTNGNVTVSWWFAPNVGLVKEYSAKGGSLFTDDYWGDDVIMKTELVSYEKLQ